MFETAHLIHKYSTAEANRLLLSSKYAGKKIYCIKIELHRQSGHGANSHCTSAQFELKVNDLIVDKQEYSITN